MRGPFDAEPREEREQKVKLKNVSSQPSMFSNMPKRQTPQEHQQQVEASQERISDFKQRASDLAMKFSKMMMDKTLPQNRGILASEIKRDLLKSFMDLARDLNNDPIEPESDGSRMLCLILFNTCFDMRDRILELEYAISLIQKKIDSTALTDFISKEINKVLDSKKTGV